MLQCLVFNISSQFENVYLKYYIYILYIKLQEKLIKIQLAPNNKSYFKFKHVSALSIL